MKVSKHELTYALTVLGKVVSKTSPVDLYKSIKIEALCDDQLQLTAYSTDEQLSMAIPAHGTERFVTAVPYLALRSSIKGSCTGMIDLCMQDDVFTVQLYSGGRISTNQLPCISTSYPETTEPPENAAVYELPACTIAALKTAAMVTDRKEARLQLRGINFSSDGITATNGKELVNIPCSELAGLHSVTLPFPSALLVCRQEERGILKTWLRDPRKADLCFSITFGNLTWQGTAICGIYPNWQKIIPAKESAAYDIHIESDDCERLVAHLKTLPEKQPYLPVSLSMPDTQTLICSSDNSCCTIRASARVPWNSYAMTVDKNVLLRLLQMGHNHIDCREHRMPFVASGGLGCYVAMPLFSKIADDAAQTCNSNTGMTQNTITTAVQCAAGTTNKETQEMEEQTTTDNGNEVINPLDELSNNLDAFKARLKVLYDESNQLTRKIKEAQLQQKQKERDFILAKRAIERIRMAI